MLRSTEIIEILETDSSILTYKNQENIPFWFLIRHETILGVLNLNNDFSATIFTGKRRLFDFLRIFFFSVTKSPIFIKKGKILFFNSGVSNVKFEGKHEFYNRITDPFLFETAEEGMLIEDCAIGDLRFPRIHKKVRLHFPLLVLSKLLGRSFNLSKEENESLMNLVDYVCSLLSAANIKYDKDAIKNIANRNVSSFQKRKQFYLEYFRIKKPRIIFLEEGSYCTRSYISLPAKQLKIPVIELQHGVVNESHIAYRLGTGVENTESAKLFYPDFFFSYGEFWSKSINIPSKIINIGNPYLSKELERLKALESVKGKKKRILFLSSGVSVKETLVFILKLVNIADTRGYEVVFRPHPSENSYVTTRYDELTSTNVVFSVGTPLYDDLFNADIIIGEITTALFEALAIENRRCYLFMSTNARSYFNEKIKIAQVTANTIDVLFSNEESYVFDKEYFWANNWKENYKQAMETIKARE